MNLENVMLNERNQSQKNCNISFLWNTQNRQIYRDRKRSFPGNSVVKNLLANVGATGD